MSVQNVQALSEVNVYINVTSQPDINHILKIFQQTLPVSNNSIAYTIVPRGLIISIAEDKFFYGDSIKLTEEGQELLYKISKGLNNLKNNCAIESHTDEQFPEKSIYKDDWEISINRATVIANFLTRYCNIEKKRLFPIGFGNSMPFRETVSPRDFTDSRIDFVIFDYAYKR